MNHDINKTRFNGIQYSIYTVDCTVDSIKFRKARHYKTLFFYYFFILLIASYTQLCDPYERLQLGGIGLVFS